MSLVAISAGMDAVAPRKDYDKDVILMGNIDKEALVGDKEAIQQEKMSKVPYLLSQGGYFPVIGHGVPPDVLFENYIYYWNERFLSEFGPKRYVNMLTLAKVGSAMVYANSHVGNCCWPTKTAHMHKGLRGRDILGRSSISVIKEI